MKITSNIGRYYNEIVDIAYEKYIEETEKHHWLVKRSKQSFESFFGEKFEEMNGIFGLEDNDCVGYLLYTLRDEGEIYCDIPVWGYGAKGKNPIKTIGCLFQHLAEKIVFDKKVNFSIRLYACDEETQKLFSFMQFGIQSEKGIRRIEEIEHTSKYRIREIIEYENKYGRECKIECEDKDLLGQINEKIKEKETYLNITRPRLLTECTACPYRKGCVTEFVCHTTSINNAIKIFESGKLLSALNARNVPVEQLMSEKRNAANDPADYFEYIMFAWGNCQAGDRLVMERALERFPNEEDLSVHFKPGVRFYFKYDELIKHPEVIFDGVLPMKVKGEIELNDWVHRIVIPMELKSKSENCIPSSLKDKIIYVENDCKDIWDWSEKVYGIIERNCG